MKVVHVITGLNDGGAEACLYSLVTADKKNQHSVVSLLDGGKYSKLLLEAGIPVYHLGFDRRTIPARGLAKLYMLLRQGHPVVQTWMYHANLVGGCVARLAGVRAIVWGIHRSTFDAAHMKPATRMIVAILARLSRFVPTRIVYCAERAAVAHEELGYCSKRRAVIPNGYNLAKFKIDSSLGGSLRGKLNIKESKPLIGMVARFDPVKDHSNLLNALLLLKNSGVECRCLLVGIGMVDSNAILAEMIGSRGLAESVLLFGPRADIPKIMNALDIHVLSSAGEAFPNVLAEAMACGTPCISTDVGDAAFIIGETGWIVPPRNAESLAVAMAKAFELFNRPEWNRRCRAARERIEHLFSLHRMTQAYNRVWSYAADGVA